MVNVVLLCAAGMSTGFIVKKIEEAAQAEGFEINVNAYPISEGVKVAADADVVLLGPQVRFKKDSMVEKFPDKAIDCIPMQMYGMMDGKGILKIIKEMAG